MSDTEFRLVRAPHAAPAPPVLDGAQRQVVDNSASVLRVLAGPGTGKTTTLVESVVDRVMNRGVPVENHLLLTFSRLAASELRDRVTARLQRTVSEPVARTFHSYAFGLVRQAAVLRDEPQVRLLSGSERDATLREMLAGRLKDGADKWPVGLREAVRTNAFVDELSDLLMRAVERDYEPARLADLGRKHGRPDWIEAARVLEEYHGVTALKSPGAYDATELIQQAIRELDRSPNLLMRERAKRRRIFVDEYQDVDPSQIVLLRMISEGADELVLIGDPDQSIYAFRGSQSRSMTEIEHDLAGGQFVPDVRLAVSRRSGEHLLAATRRIASRLPGHPAHRALSSAVSAPGQLDVLLFSSISQEAAYLATRLRRAHFEHRVPWSRMAVLVRASGLAMDSLRRGLAVAGVPVGQALRGPLSDEPVVVQLLDLLRCVARPASVTDQTAESLLTGSIGRADPLAITQIRRRLRRAPGGPLPMAALLTEGGASALLPTQLRRPVTRVREAIEAGANAAAPSESHPTGGTAEEILWAVWQATHLGPALERRSWSGGSDGARADRDLDAVLGLFAEAAKVTDRTPGGGAGQLFDWIDSMQVIDSSTLTTRPGSEAVAILTAHASKGLEWDVVCLAGVQEGVWPNLRQRGSLLGSDLLVDVHAGIGPQARAQLTERVAEERRLFYVAATRARSALIVTAVRNDDSQPSRFLDEIDPIIDERTLSKAPQRFVMAGVVAELRRAVVNPATETADRLAAAAELARLAEAGIFGADPGDWWGLADVSSHEPIRPAADGAVPIRPSKFEAYLECELKALMSEVGATDDDGNTNAALGTLIHAIAEQLPESTSVEEMSRLLDASWHLVEFGAPWHARRERERAQKMLERLATWVASSRNRYELVGVELDFAAPVGDVRLTGKVDRLERDEQGRLVVVDLKTGTTKPTKDDVQKHPQLAAYQFAVENGAFDEQGGTRESGGAMLVQLNHSNPQQDQPPLSEFDEPEWVGASLAHIAAVLRGSEVTARVGPACDRCLVKRTCPAKPDGRPVTA